MAMTERERLLTVLSGKKPDRIPYAMDMSHYYLHRFQLPWDLCNGYAEPDKQMIDFHRSLGVGFYLANQAIFSKIEYTNGVKAGVYTDTCGGLPQIHWYYDTPLGAIERIRIWNPGSYSWAVKQWGVKTEKDLEIYGYAMSSRRYTAIPENFDAWVDYIGEDGLLRMDGVGSSIGHLLNHWMGVENTIYACYDWEDLLDEVNAKVDAALLEQLEIACGSFKNGEVVDMGDNFSSDVQSPKWLKRWSGDFYKKAHDIIHKHGKIVSEHIDGKLKGLIGTMRDLGADMIDAVTPGSVGGMTAAQAREEAGPDLILCGGIPNELWYEYAPMEKFEQAVKDWLALKEISPALIMAAGDQVPPGAEERKIVRMGELVDEYGWY